MLNKALSRLCTHLAVEIMRTLQVLLLTTDILLASAYSAVPSLDRLVEHHSAYCTPRRDVSDDPEDSPTTVVEKRQFSYSTA